MPPSLQRAPALPRPASVVPLLGVQVGVNYDPMIAKLVVHGPDRPAALASLHGALQELQVGAVHGAGGPMNMNTACTACTLGAAPRPVALGLPQARAATGLQGRPGAGQRRLPRGMGEVAV